MKIIVGNIISRVYSVKSSSYRIHCIRQVVAGRKLQVDTVRRWPRVFSATTAICNSSVQTINYWEAAPLDGHWRESPTTASRTRFSRASKIAILIAGYTSSGGINLATFSPRKPQNVSDRNVESRLQ